MQQETEIRAHFEKRDDAIQKLAARGVTLGDPIVQWDQMFDTPEGSLFSSGRKIRIRREGSAAELTVKGAFGGDGTASRRTENNIALSGADAERMAEIMEFLGYPMLFQVKKTRQMSETSDGIIIALDEWPIIGALLELEGNEEKIKKFAADVFPDVRFGNPRLKTLFMDKMKQENKSLAELIAREETHLDYRLGNLEFLIK